MARVSKGKLKYIRQLYHYRIETCKLMGRLLNGATMWFYEPDPKVRKITEAWLSKNMMPQPSKGYCGGVKRLNYEPDMELCITFDRTNYPNFNQLSRTKIRRKIDQLVGLNEGWLEPLVIKLPDASGA